MKNIISLIFIFFLIGRAFAFADVPPACPSPNEVKKHIIKYTFPPQAGDPYQYWSGSSPDLIGIFTGISIQMYESGLDYSSALTLAQKIQQTTTTFVEQKVFLSSTSTEYFWSCRYDIDDRNVFFGDSMYMFSDIYNSDGKLSKTKLSPEKKYSLMPSFNHLK